MAAGDVIVVRIDWRRGPRELRSALDETRRQVMQNIGAEIKRKAPHPSLRDAVTIQRSQVKVDHPAAWFWEFGVAKQWRGPPQGLVDWAEAHGKTLREAFAVARAGINIPRSPYIQPAIDKVMGRVGMAMRNIWGH